MTTMAMTNNFVRVATEDTESDYIEYKQFKEKKIIKADDDYMEYFAYTIFHGYHWDTLTCRTSWIYDLYRVYLDWKLILESEDEVIELPKRIEDRDEEIEVRAYDKLWEDRLILLWIGTELFSDYWQYQEPIREKSDSYKLSVVVPCYKSESFMCRTIDAILSSSMDNLQLILVNDGSPDNALEIMKRYEKNYWCVKVINQENLKLSMARNNWLANVDWEYVAFCDSDDIPHPLMYEKLYNACIENNTDIAIWQVLIHELPEKRAWVFKQKENVVYDFDEMMKKKSTNENIYFVAVNNKIVKTETARKTEFSRDFIGKTFVYEDIAYTWSLYSYIDRFSYCADAIYTRDKRKRQTEGTVSTWHRDEDNDYTWKTFIYWASYPLYHKSWNHLERHDYIHFQRLIESYKKFNTPCPLRTYWDIELSKLITSQKLYENKLIMADKELGTVVRSLYPNIK